MSGLRSVARAMRPDADLSDLDAATGAYQPVD